jgi:RNA polymerase sigma factor (sigma-70 family)
MSATALISSPAGDETSRLYEQHRERILAYCTRRLGNRQDAEDALQTTFIYAFGLLQRGARPDCELAWLYAIAHNACRTRQRSLRRRRHVETSTDPDTIDRQGRADQPDREQLHALRTALEGLPAGQRRALLLREWQGLSYDEIADELALSHAATETLLFRARRNLAGRLVQSGQRVAVVLTPGPVLRLARKLLGGTTAANAAAATLVLGVATTVPAAQSHTPPRQSPRAAPAAIERPAHVPRSTSATVRFTHVVKPRRTGSVHVVAAAAVRAAPAPVPPTVLPPEPAPAEPAATPAPVARGSAPTAPVAPAAPATEIELPAVDAPPPPVDVPSVPVPPQVDVPVPPPLPPVTVTVPDPPAPPPPPSVPLVSRTP